MRHTAPNTIAPVEVVAGQLGPQAEVIGALTLALQSTEVATDHQTITTMTDESQVVRSSRTPPP